MQGVTNNWLLPSSVKHPEIHEGGPLMVQVQQSALLTAEQFP